MPQTRDRHKPWPARERARSEMLVTSAPGRLRRLRISHCATGECATAQLPMGLCARSGVRAFGRPRLAVGSVAGPGSTGRRDEYDRAPIGLRPPGRGAHGARRRARSAGSGPTRSTVQEDAASRGEADDGRPGWGRWWDEGAYPVYLLDVRCAPQGDSGELRPGKLPSLGVPRLRPARPPHRRPADGRGLRAARCVRAQGSTGCFRSLSGVARWRAGACWPASRSGCPLSTPLPVRCTLARPTRLAASSRSPGPQSACGILRRRERGRPRVACGCWPSSLRRWRPAQHARLGRARAARTASSPPPRCERASAGWTPGADRGGRHPPILARCPPAVAGEPDADPRPDRRHGCQLELTSVPNSIARGHHELDARAPDQPE